MNWKKPTLIALWSLVALAWLYWRPSARASWSIQ